MKSVFKADCGFVILNLNSYTSNIVFCESKLTFAKDKGLKSRGKSAIIREKISPLLITICQLAMNCLKIMLIKRKASHIPKIQ